MNTTSNEQFLDRLMEGVKLMMGIGRKLRGDLVWHVQLKRHPISGKPLDPDHPNDAYHFAKTPFGTFEISEVGDALLLFFPRSMKLPAELFYDLADAKARALSALRDASE